MTLARQIADRAASLFDVVGVTQLPGGEYLLILGLESTPERNLDEFGHSDGGFQMFGFEKYVRPRLESLLKPIRRQGFAVQPVGRLGYPLGGEVNLKEAAIRAGLGKRGKSTVVLHPEYGPRLRFIAIRTNAPLETLVAPAQPEKAATVCQECSICVDVCPVAALEPYRMPDPSLCLSNITPVTEDGRSVLCDVCLKFCPAGNPL